jgi:ferredoxin
VSRSVTAVPDRSPAEAAGDDPSNGTSAFAFTDACTACGACLLTCPEAAIVVGIPLRVRDDRCTCCGECLEVCPADAVVELGGRA